MDKEELEKIIRKEGNMKLWKKDDFYCFIKRMRDLGHLCGYIGVKKKHSLYGMNYCFWNDDIDKWKAKEKKKAKFIDSIEVHGGLTYSGKWNWFQLEDIWWFGFDTAHSGDLSMYMLESDTLRGIAEKNIYRDIKYVEKEIKKLIKQFKKYD